MDKIKRPFITYLGLMGILVATSVIGWASIVPGELSVRPKVTINQAIGQVDATNTAPIHFSVVFSKSVTGFASNDVTLSGTAPGALTTTVSGSGKTYDVSVSGMSGTGTVTANLAAGVAHDAVGNTNLVSTSNDNTVTYVVTAPTVTPVPTATATPRPTSTPIPTATPRPTATATPRPTATSRPTATPSPTATPVPTATPAPTATATPRPTATAVPTATPRPTATAVPTATPRPTATPAPTALPPTVTVNQAARQVDPTNTAPIHFTVVFSRAVTDFASGDVTLSGTAPGNLVKTITGSGTTYDVSVSGMTGTGTVVANIAAGVAHDALGNATKTSTSTDNVVTYDVTPLTATINQTRGQVDPTNTRPVHFTVVFSRTVTDFTFGDVALTGTAPGNLVKTVTGSGRTYDVSVTGMTGSGTIVANLPAGVAHDAVRNASKASTSTDNSITYDVTAPTVTVNQATGQVDPTNTRPIHFTVVFSRAVSDFVASDVTLTGTAPGTLVKTIRGSGATYDVSVTGMTGSGTVIARLAAAVAHDRLGNASKASTSTDNVITYDVNAPTVTVNQATRQADPTNIAPIHFTVVFSRAVTDFASGDVTLTGTAPGTLVKTITGSGTTYDVSVSGMTGTGTVVANIAAGVAHDAVGNASKASTSNDNSVTYDVTAPTVTINQAASQIDPTNIAPIHFTVVFSRAVADFTAGDVTLTGTAPGTLVKTITGSGTTYDVSVTGMTGTGTVVANIAAGVAHDAVGNANEVSTSTDNVVTYDVTAPTVTINQATSQIDPTNTAPIHFTVVFSKVVTDFTSADVTLSGTAPGAIVATITGSGTTYDVSVSGMTGTGTVIANLAAGVAHDAVGNANTVSTSTDNSVTYDVTPLTVTVNQAASQSDPTNTSPIHFTVVFSTAVTDFTFNDVALTGTAPGTLVKTITGSGTTYDVSVTGMTDSGTIIASIAAGAAHDAVGNASEVSTSTDNSITYDVTAPTVTVNQATSQTDPTSVAPIHFTVVFSKVVTDFTSADVTLSGTAPGAIIATITGSGTTYDVSVTGMSGTGTVIADIAAGTAHDALGNANTVSTSTDNIVTYDVTSPNLGRAATFGAFGDGAGMTNQGVNTVVNGDIGTTAGSTTITGFHDSTGDVYTETTQNIGNVTGRIYTDAPPPTIFASASNGPVGGNAATKLIADQAAADALSAYNQLQSRPTTAPDPSAAGELSGLTLAPGVYKSAGGSFNIMSGGTLTLDAQGDANAIWIFQMGSSFNMGAIGAGNTPARVVFANGVGQPKNVYWQVGSSATINTGSQMVGTIISSAGITFSTPGQVIMTTLDGRALSLNASVTMVNTIINVPAP